MVDVSFKAAEGGGVVNDHDLLPLTSVLWQWLGAVNYPGGNVSVDVIAKQS